VELIKSQKEDLNLKAKKKIYSNLPPPPPPPPPQTKKNPKERFEIYLDIKCLRKGHQTMSMKSNLETAVYILCHSYTRKGFFFFLFFFFFYVFIVVTLYN
jgi:hypothetical protein